MQSVIKLIIIQLFFTYSLHAQYCQGNFFTNGNFEMVTGDVDYLIDNDINLAVGWQAPWLYSGGLADLSNKRFAGNVPMPNSGNFASIWIINSSNWKESAEFREGMYNRLINPLYPNESNYQFSFDCANSGITKITTPIKIGIYGVYNPYNIKSDNILSLHKPLNTNLWSSHPEIKIVLLNTIEIQPNMTNQWENKIVTFNANNLPKTGITHILITSPDDVGSSYQKLYLHFDNFCMHNENPNMRNENIIVENKQLELQNNGNEIDNNCGIWQIPLKLYGKINLNGTMVSTVDVKDKNIKYIILDCNETYSIIGKYNCNNKNNAEPLFGAMLYKPNGEQIQLNCNKNNSFTPYQSGTYFLRYYAKCNDVICDSNSIVFSVGCKMKDQIKPKSLFNRIITKVTEAQVNTNPYTLCNLNVAFQPYFKDKNNLSKQFKPKIIGNTFKLEFAPTADYLQELNILNINSTNNAMQLNCNKTISIINKFDLWEVDNSFSILKPNEILNIIGPSSIDSKLKEEIANINAQGFTEMLTPNKWYIITSFLKISTGDDEKTPELINKFAIKYIANTKQIIIAGEQITTINNNNNLIK